MDGKSSAGGREDMIRIMYVTAIFQPIYILFLFSLSFFEMRRNLYGSLHKSYTNIIWQEWQWEENRMRRVGVMMMI